MNRFLPVARLALFLALATWLGVVVMKIPKELTLSLPDKGVTVSVPRNLEGWVLEPGEGEILVKGHTRTGLVSLEIAAVPVSGEDGVYRYIVERQAQLKEGKQEYVVWHQGTDAKFGRRPAPTYKATYRGEILGPLEAEFWHSEVYWPYKGQYARISMRYPDFLVNYVEPDVVYIASRIRFEQEGEAP